MSKTDLPEHGQHSGALELDLSLDEIPALVARAAERWPDREAVRFDLTDERLTFSELHTRTNAIAQQLIRLGTRPGDRVAVMCRNRAAFPLAWIAIVKARAVMVPVNTFAKDVDAGHILRHSGSTTIIVESRFAEFIGGLRLAVPELVNVVIADEDRGALEQFVPVTQAELLAADPVPDPPYERYLPEDLANIQYTSGTTGNPKGCMLSNQYWTRLSRLVIDCPPTLTEDDILLTAQPFSYMDPQWNLLAGIQIGAAVVVLDRFHPSTFWKKVAEYRATFFYCLGAMPALMERMPPQPHDLDHRVRYVACSAIPVTLHKKLEDRFGAPWFELFGSTETGGDLTVPPQEREELVGTACIGRPYPHREVRIVGENERPLPRGEIGQIVLRGESMMDGYFRNDEATSEAFRFGWYHTGDLGWMDQSGRVFFHGRVKDIIRRSGENISAVEVESTIGQHSAVRLAACVPVEDDLRGEEIKAFVVLNSGSKVEPDELAAFCAERLAYYKVPRYWEFRPMLPMTASQKIAKGELRAERPRASGRVYDSVERKWS